MKHVTIIAMMMILLSSVLWAQKDSVSSSKMKKNSIGLGFGIPYGILGVNLDINVATNLNLSGGVGTTILAGIGYNLGLKYFFIPIEQTFRPRVSAYYGTNTVSEVPRIGTFGSFSVSSGKETKSYSGLNLGIGAQLMWGETKSNGLDFDIIYLATTELDIEELRDEGFVIEDPGNVKIAIGYRYAF
jgi:hypothetical protein